MKKKVKFSEIIKYFSPAWYASVMGTGGLANVFYMLSSKMHFLKSFAISLFFLNIFLFFFLLIPWILRWILAFDKVIEDLKHPVMSNFFVTMPIGGLILGTNFFIIGKEFISMSIILGFGIFFWIFSVALSLIFGVFVTYNMMLSENIGPELTNYSWYITPVASVAVPLLGNILANFYLKTNIEFAKLINIIDISFYGIGMILFIILSSIILNRFINHSMPHAATTPTFWIILGPIGIGQVTLSGIADISKKLGLISSGATLKLLSIILWGFGLWAFLLTIIVTLNYIRRGGIPFSLSWWAFIFPLSAYTMSTLNVYMYTKIKLIYWYAIFLASILTLIWVSTFVRSLIGTLNGKLLIPHQKNSGKSSKN
ncbi:C4-dicarboxylate transporter/malic acid transport protein [Thermosipho japonicus]|uniref:C4-dicarboxylate transporter/malic acid transport protein n=1 Tax=Thermosipho japonicus TaxID=90323 RepID=A0A841GMX5_9BACT|nr:C4-dicarboxylate ABC transporter [Thermosipho japonicus]MBB6063345.1 C4-dicarboxylate transporter/malic acid transport protein [Thermosipho japonicus]